MRKLKRLLAGVLTAAMLATFLPAGVLAAGANDPALDGEAVVEGTQNIEPEEQEKPGEPVEPEEGKTKDLPEELYVKIGEKEIPVMLWSNSTYSMQNLPNKYYFLDLEGYFPEELKAVNVSDMLAALKRNQNDDEPAGVSGSTKVVAMAKWGYINEDEKTVLKNDNFTRVEDGVLDLSYAPKRYGSGTYEIQLIIGENDQLDDSNVRYVVYVSVDIPYYGNLFTAEAATTGNPRSQIRIIGEPYFGDNYGDDYYGGLYLTVDPRDWKVGDRANMSLSPSSEYNALGFRTNDVKVYSGHYRSAEEVNGANAKLDITGEIWQQTNLTASGGYEMGFSDPHEENENDEEAKITLVLSRNGHIALIQPLNIYMQENSTYVGLQNYLYAEGSNTQVSLHTSPSGGSNGLAWTYTLMAGNGVDGTYRVRANGTASMIDSVKMYDAEDKSVAAVELSETDRNDLFSGGYAVNFGDHPNGVRFEVLDVYGEPHQLEARVKTQSVDVFVDGLYKEAGGSNQATYRQNDYGMENYFYLKFGNKLSDSYYVKMRCNNGALVGSDATSPANIKAAYVGDLSQAQINSQPNIKDALFGTDGYRVDFSQYANGKISFTIVDTNDALQVETFRLVEWSANVYFNGWLYETDGSDSYTSTYDSEAAAKEKFKEYRLYWLPNGKDVGGTYNVKLSFRDPETGSSTYNSTRIKGAYVSTKKLTLAETASAANVKDTIFGSSGCPVTFSNYPNGAIITVVDGNDHLTYLFAQISGEGVYVSLDGLYTDADTKATHPRSPHNDYVDPETGVQWSYVSLLDGYSSTDSYLVKLYHDSKADNAIKGAYMGLFKTEAECSGKTDIKSQLFGNGYSVNFGDYPDSNDNWPVFTVITNSGVVHIGVGLRLDIDTYFKVTGAVDANGKAYKAYVVRVDHDDSANVYQTVLLLDENNNPVTAKEIYPTFETDHKVKIYAGRGEIGGYTAGATLQTSGKSAVAFDGTGSRAIEYSAAAESGRYLQNYFVTFLTPQNEAALFVNGTNDESNYDKDLNIAMREIKLSKTAPNHDIFFANVGKSKLNNLSVKLTALDGSPLENPTIALDEYWTLQEGSSLNAFTSVDKGMYVDSSGAQWYDEFGELPNVGKIRIVPAKDAEGNPVSGPIEALLTISAGGSEVVKIKLTGTSGDLRLNTSKLLDGVQYVSYSSVIQTNYIGGTTNAVSLTATGLPSGIRLRPNGELYGVPMKAGSFEVTITATITGMGTVTQTYKTYNMVIADPENMDVWKYDQRIFGDEYYTPAIAIPNENTNDTSNISGDATYGGNNWSLEAQVLQTHTEGQYQYFVNRVFIDGVQLVEGTDYTSEPGSIKLTIQTQTLRSFGNGTHTISAESRIGNKDTGDLRRTAQNYTLSTLGTSRPSSSGSSSSGSDDSITNSVTASSTPQNGTVSVSHENAPSGTKVIITVKPDPGYEVDQIIVTDMNGNQIPVTKEKENQYSFRMPNSKVQIQTTFKPIVSDGPFRDVSKDAWYNQAVTYVYEKGLMVGVSEGIFAPNDITVRAMLATVLHNMEEKPEVEDLSLMDVPLDQWYSKPIFWAAENEVMAGYGNGYFGPTDSLTREQVAVILYNYSKMKGYDLSAEGDLDQFADSDEISEWARPALAWANAIGLINGYGNGILAPKDGATRAQIATILMNFCMNIEQ